MSDVTASSDDGEDYVYGGGQLQEIKRYPVHDCCEFEDVESLRALILIPEDSDDDSSSDENDSAAAAHAAAIGHSPQPQPLPPKVMIPNAVVGEEGVMEAEAGDKDTNDTVDGVSKNQANEGLAPMAISPKEGVINEVIDAAPKNGQVQENASVGKVKKRRKYYCPHNLNERDTDENTPLHIAIHARKLEHVKLLLEAGASIHKKSDGSAPIHLAISMGSVGKHADFAYQCVVFLTEKGADLSVKDDSMHTPLYLACMFCLPEIVRYILSHENGKTTLNARADRSQGRPLHAAAKSDTSVPRAAALNPAAGAGEIAPLQVTKLLLGAPDIEVDAMNSVGQSPLHIACSRGNWPVVRLLLEAGADANLADRRGFTPGQLAHKRGMPILNDLLEVLGGPPSSGVVAPPRDLVVDPDGKTIVLTHELCGLHKTCAPIRRDPHSEPPPENVKRLHVLTDDETGILRSGEFSKCTWENETRRAAMVDVLKCHEYNYVESISQLCSSIPDHPSAIAHLDADTAMSRWSFESALRAAGSVCEAVDKVMSGEFRNAFCAVRPPGHHAGPRGIVRCENDPDGGSHGFCFLNNIAIGAAYARSMYRNENIRKVAIIDFDVHHGNGTEEIIRQLVPTVEKSIIRTPFAIGELGVKNYRPWLDETDVHNVFFASAHGYGPRGIEFADTPQAGWFYPASGKTVMTDNVKDPSSVETPNLTDFLLSQTWTRMGAEAQGNCCKIINCGLGLPTRDAVPGMQRLEVRDTYRKKILPQLLEFDPDIIFISAGFDAHKRDSMNFGYVGMVEDDYEWVTAQLVRIANTCCNGRIVSVLEGGYKIHGGIVSPFARSVAAHVRSLVDGGSSRELYDAQDGEWESQFERHLIDERERKRQQKLEKMKLLELESRRALYGDDAGNEEEGDAPRKRKRNQVDYRSLYEQMKKEGFAT
ncbi:unnamed protein product [Cylindrotheca closterium]|uniref:Histone deacetylase domain-containing protein n=1 Tax=Cylindrotheca closterium TaxID=2856 RepID=A0AAD2FUH3_9STRA|nr:unnamed protein product [Cylindrotheca closterium]